MDLNVSKITSKVDEIDECIQNLLEAELSEREYINLLSGKQGITLFLYLKALHNNSSTYINKIEELLVTAFNSLNKVELTPNYCTGIAGFLFNLKFLEKNQVICFDKKMKHYEKLLNSYLDVKYLSYLKKRNYDFLHGAEGILYYFINNDIKREQIDNYLLGLDKTKVEIKGRGIAWRSNISIKEGNKRVFNLGLAHGMSSTIMLLSKILVLECNADKKLAKELLKGVIEFFFSERLSENYISTFPNYSSLDQEVVDSRLAWCYGDLGVCLALLQAGIALDDKELVHDVTEICLKTLNRKEESETKIKDAGLCHGSSGVAMIYSKFYQLTNNAKFEKASIFWIDQTLKLAQFKDGMAGFKTWTSEGYKSDYNLLNGVAGIGLVLLSNILNEKTQWQQCLMS